MAAEATFADMEREGWSESSVANAYASAEGFGELTTQCVEQLLNGARAKAGSNLLDVACGPGFVAEAALKHDCKVVGMDISDAMLELARARCDGKPVQFVAGDAQAMPFADESFDCVAANFCILHLPEPEHFLAEAFRVLKPGGTVAFTVWQAPPATLGFDIVLGAVRAEGNPDVPLPTGPPFFAFADSAHSEAALTRAGFTEALLESAPQTLRLPTPEALAPVFEKATVRTRALLAAQSPAAAVKVRAAIAQGVRERAERSADGSAWLLPMPAALSTARKPLL